MLGLTNLGEGRKMFKFTIISAAAATLSATTLAAPLLTLKFNVDGKKSTISQVGDETGFGDFSYMGSVGDGYPVTSWVVGWDLASNSSSRSFVTNGFTIANLGNTTRRFNITLDVVDTAPAGNLWTFSGNLGGALTSNTSSAAILSSYGSNPLWQGLRGGTSPGANSELLRDFTLTSPGATTWSLPNTSITPYNVAGPLGPSMGYQFQFDLTGGSSVAFTGNWVATVVPAPGVFALCGLAGIGLQRKRRSM